MTDKPNLADLRKSYEHGSRRRPGGRRTPAQFTAWLDEASPRACPNPTR
jgi:hypothetical protein